MSYFKSDLTQKEIRNLLPGYVFGILEPTELGMFHAYLTKHPELQVEIVRFEDIASKLAYSVPLDTPPALLKRQILLAIRANAPAHIKGKRP